MSDVRIVVTKEDYSLVCQLKEAAYNWLVGEMCCDPNDSIFTEADELSDRIRNALVDDLTGGTRKL